MTNINKHGLLRSIPAEVKREVRRASGFGCVICGASITHYEHVDPEFQDAKEHDPSAITLLCPRHHEKVTRRLMSKSTVKEAMANPKCRQIGYASEMFDIGRQQPTILFAGQRIENCQIPIQIQDFPVIEVKPAEVTNGPFRIGANFFDARGRLSLSIVDNEWRAYESNWDAEVKGPRIIVRGALRQISLQLKAIPPNELIVEKIDMRVAGYDLRGGRDGLSIRTSNGSSLFLAGSLTSNCRVGLCLS